MNSIVNIQHHSERCPIMDFIKIMFEKAQSDLRTIVLPEGSDRRTLEAAAIIQQRKIARCIILGNEDQIRNLSDGLDISQSRIVDPDNFDQHEAYSQAFHDLRKLKGISLDDARKIICDPLYLGVMMVKLGEADGMVAGAINSTSNVLRPALQVIKARPGTKLVSGFFVIVVPDCPYGHDGTFVFADSGLVENPNAEDMAEIAVTSAASFQALFGIEPIVGMLSYSTYGSAKSRLTRKVIRATKLAKAKNPSLQVDGELQFDAAIIPDIGRSKAPASEVAGKANVLVFPDLNSGNIAYKVAERLGNAKAFGLITQGLAKPVNDLSRGCSAEDIVGVVAVTAVQAQALDI